MRSLALLVALIWLVAFHGSVAAAEEEPKAGSLVPDRLKPKQPRLDRDGRSSLGQPSGACARSVFETRVPYMEWVPDESSQRLSSPARHPDRSVCGSYANKDSCCSAKTLQDLVDWSDANDASMGIAEYVVKTIERDPRLLVDQVIVNLRARLLDQGTDWKKIRDTLREPIGDLIRDGWKTVFPPLTELRSAVVTYQEGLLCSACEPNFERFFNGSVIKMRVDAAGEVADGVIKSLAAFDTFIESQTPQITQLAQTICSLVGGGVACIRIPDFFPPFLNYFKLSSLRELFCGPTRGNLDVHNIKCRDFVMFTVLRGLYIDVEPIVDNMFDYFERSCPKTIPGVTCPSAEAAKKVLHEYFFTFDERPVVWNTYGVDGYDVKSAACGSYLSGYACGGPGPKSQSHQAPAPAGNSGPVIIVIVVLLVVASLGVVLFISRERIKRVTHSWYLRMRDGDDNSGPTVGLV